MKYGTLKLEQSTWYKDCVKYYSNLNVEGKSVLDIGSDFGTSPMYFIKNGATMVIGVSFEDQYFKDGKYTHHKFTKDNVENFEIFDMAKRLLYHLDILKCDAEGFEWQLTPQFIESFEDWVVSLHTPITNPELYEWIKKNGKLLGTEITEEFATYQKVK